MSALINVVIPIFGVILTGYLAGRFDLLGQDSAAALNRFVYYFAIPAALFIFTARAPIDRTFNWSFIAAFTGGSVLTLLIALIVGRLWFRHDMATLGVAGMTAVFGQMLGVGLPLLLTVYGTDGALPSIVAALIYTFLFLTTVIAVLEAARARERSPLQLAWHLAGTLVRNPVVVSPVLGILYSSTGLPLPKAAGNYLDLMAAAVAPAALFSVGLSLVGRKLTRNAGEVMWLSLLKTAVNPVLTFVVVTYVFVLDAFWSQVAVILSAMPVGTNPYVVAQQYNVHIETVSPTIVVSTAMSVVTVFVALIWFGVG